MDQSAHDRTLPPHPSPERYEPRRTPIGRTGIAWVVIAVLCTAMVVAHMLPEPSPEPAAEPDGVPLDVIMMTFQSQVLVGMTEMWGGAASPGQMYRQNARPLNAGPVAQRQRFIVLAADLAGPDEAQRQLERLDGIIAEAQDGREEPVLSEAQQQVQEILHTLYSEQVEDSQPNLEALDAQQRDVLVQELGWFGQLALLPRGVDDAARDAVVGPARTVAIIVIIAMILGGLALLGGFIALIIFFVLVLGGKVRSGIDAGRAHHGIHAETFAIWLPLFIALQFLSALVGVYLPELRMLLAFIAFFVSLAALAWPGIRGVPWHDVRHDIGLTLGRTPFAEPLYGILGYIMALPMLVVGLILTLVLMGAYSIVAGGESQPLAPGGAPAHPVVEMFAGANWWSIVQIILVAVVAAPVVEEIMFRGVLYRHLRGATDVSASGDAMASPTGFGTSVSVLLSATINGFLFAVIHPQGLLAVPALMSLAYAFALVREWRGTIIPAVVVHGISNGLVMTLLIVVVGFGGH